MQYISNSTNVFILLITPSVPLHYSTMWKSWASPFPISYFMTFFLFFMHVVLKSSFPGFQAYLDR